jgi:hypothetical protein
MTFKRLRKSLPKLARDDRPISGPDVNRARSLKDQPSWDNAGQREASDLLPSDPPGEEVGRATHRQVD